MNTRDFAGKVGCNCSTLRTYERADLLIPKRTATNHRNYTIADLATYHIIHSLRRAGLPLSDIHHILQLRSQMLMPRVRRIHCGLSWANTANLLPISTFTRRYPDSLTNSQPPSPVRPSLVAK